MRQFTALMTGLSLYAYVQFGINEAIIATVIFALATIDIIVNKRK